MLGAINLTPTQFRRPVRETLENWGKVVWIPILAIASLSLLVGYCNTAYRRAASDHTLSLTAGQQTEAYSVSIGKTLVKRTLGM